MRALEPIKSAENDYYRPLIRAILEKADRYKWSLQGFGMLRLHLSDAVRLNIWHRRFRVPQVSLIHTHPWDFTSTIVAGRLLNRRFVPSDAGAPFNRAVIKPGPGGGLLENVAPLNLLALVAEAYHPGMSYSQRKDEVHVSLPDDGTITLNRRVRIGEDVAYVMWPVGEKWVTAEPREASAEEVTTITLQALALLDAAESK